MNKQAIIEGALIAAGKPLSIEEIKIMFKDEEESPNTKEISSILEDIGNNCVEKGYELKELASGYRLQVKPEYAKWVSKLWEDKPPKYSKAILEIMAIIAYKQPITRAEIEEIRGVAVSTNAIRMLMDRKWIKVIAHKDVPGKPAVYGTTKEFLDYFNLSHLNELPEIDLANIEFSKDVVDDEKKGFQLENIDDEMPELQLQEESQENNIIDISEQCLEKQKENLHPSDVNNDISDVEIVQ